MMDHAEHALRLNRRGFTLGAGAAMATALASTLPAGFAMARSAGDAKLVALPPGDGAARALRWMAGDSGGKSIVLMHGVVGLDKAIFALCAQLTGAGRYSIAPDLHGTLAVDCPSLSRGERLHRIDSDHVATLLDAAAAFAATERADGPGVVYLAAGANGRSFAKSGSADFARVETRMEAAPFTELPPAAREAALGRFLEWLDA